MPKTTASGRRGRVGLRRASLSRQGDLLTLQVGGQEFDLMVSRVDHRDRWGWVTFEVRSDDGRCVRRRYVRRKPSVAARLLLELTYKDEEPSNWEDSDFGLFVFDVRHGIGPAKYRHTLLPPNTLWKDLPDAGPHRTSVVAGRIAAHGGLLGLTTDDQIDVSSIQEVAIKYDLSGIYIDLANLVLRGPASVVVLPLRTSEPDWWAPLLTELRALPGWTASADAHVEQARNYSETGYSSFFTRRAERSIWARRAGGEVH